MNTPMVDAFQQVAKDVGAVAPETLDKVDVKNPPFIQAKKKQLPRKAGYILANEERGLPMLLLPYALRINCTAEKLLFLNSHGF
jgi:hypothetical protein